MTISSISITIHLATREIVSVSRKFFPLLFFLFICIGLKFNCNKKLQNVLLLMLRSIGRCAIYIELIQQILSQPFFFFTAFRRIEKCAWQFFVLCCENFHKERIKLRSLGLKKCSCLQKNY